MTTETDETLNAVRSLAGQLEIERVGARIAEAGLASAIRNALEAGNPVGLIADAAGISRQRVYQIRDGKR